MLERGERVSQLHRLQWLRELSLQKVELEENVYELKIQALAVVTF